MLIVEILIPLADNDGRTFTSDHHAAFEAALAGLFGGFSRLPGTVTGGWQHEGRLYRDDLVVYAVALPSIVEGAKVGEAVEIAKAHYAQLAIFIRYLGFAETR
jgi:hypothetical protein